MSAQPEFAEFLRQPRTVQGIPMPPKRDGAAASRRSGWPFALA